MSLDPSSQLEFLLYRIIILENIWEVSSYLLHEMHESSLPKILYSQNVNKQQCVYYILKLCNFLLNNKTQTIWHKGRLFFCANQPEIVIHVCSHTKYIICCCPHKCFCVLSFVKFHKIFYMKNETWFYTNI